MITHTESKKKKAFYFLFHKDQINLLRRPVVKPKWLYEAEVLVRKMEQSEEMSGRERDSKVTRVVPPIGCMWVTGKRDLKTVTGHPLLTPYPLAHFIY